MPLEGIPNFRARQAWIAFAVALVSLSVSLGAFYYFFRPRIREKITEKPVDRVVEKTVERQVPVPCPKTKSMTPGIAIQKGAQVQGITNAPNSMAAGINTGTMMQGDVSPQLVKSLISENEKETNGYVTKFAVQVTTNHIFPMQVVVTGKYITNFNAMGDGDFGSSMMNVMVSPQRGSGTVQNIHSGRFVVTVFTSQPDTIALEVNN